MSPTALAELLTQCTKRLVFSLLVVLAGTAPVEAGSAGGHLDPPLLEELDGGARLERVDEAVGLLKSGSLADAVQAAAVVGELWIEAPRFSPQPAPTGLPPDLEVPIGRLLGAIDRAAQEVRLAIPDPQAAEQLADAARLYGAALLLAEELDATLPALVAAASAVPPDGPAATPVEGCDVLDLVPTLCVGGSGPNVYSEDAALVLDLGGDDVHTHSAGGAEPQVNGLVVAVTVDLAGDDRYEHGRRIAQGAGNLGLGILVDAAGDDTYSIVAEQAIGQGTNFSPGGGLLADLEGSDTYSLVSTRLAMGQGRATQPAFGMLLDRGSGNDAYLLSASPASPIESPDEVRLQTLSASGMGFGSQGAVGIFADDGGADTMVLEAIYPVIPPDELRPVAGVPATPLGGQTTGTSQSAVSPPGAHGLGGGIDGGTGLHYSGPGPTERRASAFLQAPVAGGVSTSAFGWSDGGLGVLIDEGGNDIYLAEAASHATRTVRVGDAEDGSGGRAELSAAPGVAAGVRAMGAAISRRVGVSVLPPAEQGVALLHDHDGNDTYRAVATAVATAEVVDERSTFGDDDPQPSESLVTASQVAVEAQGVGMGARGVLEDLGGDDLYEVTARSDATASARAQMPGVPVVARARAGNVFTDAQGAGTACCGNLAITPGTGVLRDTGGADMYRVTSESTATADPPTEVVRGEVASSAQASVTGNSVALLHDRDEGLPDLFELTPKDAACEGTRGEGTWRDCGEGVGMGIVEGDEPSPPPEPVVTELDDSDPAIEYRRGWHRRSDPSASHGGYHRRLGSPGGGEAPTARLVFEGHEITYFFGRSEQGGTADVFLDGAFATTVDYSGPGPGNSPEFDHSITFEGLDAGTHEILIAHRSGAVYVDGFEIVSSEGGGADPSAAKTRSVTTTSTGELPRLGSTMLVETVEVGPNDEWLSVVVEGAEELVTVNLLDSLGTVVAAAGQLLAGSSAVGLDVPPALAGTYTVQVLDGAGNPATVEISIARTIALE